MSDITISKCSCCGQPMHPSDYSDRLKADLAAKTAECERLREALLAAADHLDEAADCIDDWGQYAGDYFQTKHGLAEDVAVYQQRAQEAKTAARKETP